MSDKKWIDKGNDAPPSLISPRTLALIYAQADEFRKRAEAAEAELRAVLAKIEDLEREKRERR